jgi:parvulin-like peptidyl-prolyl isomerase
MEDMMDAADPFEMERQLREWSRENVIEKTLLRQQALADAEPLPEGTVDRAIEQIRGADATSCPVTPANEEALRKDIELRLKIDRLMEKIAAQVPPPKYKLVGDFYRKYKERFRTPELVRVKHIVKHVNESATEQQALAAIRDAEQELSGGAAFEDVADRHSDCKGNGGDLGYFPRGEMVPEFDEIVFPMNVGATSPVFRTAFGFHIARLYDRQPARVQDLTEVRDQIEKELHAEKKQRAVEDYLDRLKAKADIRDVVRQVAPA